ncbi:biopolymer transporter ExbD, partial [Phenylobacterium sp.]|uniref:biopolymer transporter ExbD n=1 Tax=Phenylobacterium sp. TaxID=1871053 RepID=UPI0035242B9D
CLAKGFRDHVAAPVPGALGKEIHMGAKLGGGGGGGKFDLGQNSDINVTPFVDVMLVLLIIFMVAIPAATVSIKLDLPPAIPPPPGSKIVEPTLINIQEAGLYIGDIPTTLDTLPADLTRILSVDKPEPTEERVYIRADRTVRYGDFMAVMNTLQSNGFFQVALINEEL